ncbi:MAG: hypothetical protein ACPF9Q_02700, partial [Opitutales bacterium]
ACSAPNLSAAVRLFDFDLGRTRGWSGTSGTGPYVNTVDGLTITMSTNDDWNPTLKGFASGFSAGTEVLGMHDGYSIQISFSHDVKFMEFEVGRAEGLSGDERVRFTATGLTTFDENRGTVGSYDFQNQFTLVAGTVLTLTEVNPDISATVINWKRIQVEADIVPEPQAYALLLGTVAFGLGYYRRRQKRRSS